MGQENNEPEYPDIVYELLFPTKANVISFRKITLNLAKIRENFANWAKPSSNFDKKNPNNEKT